MVRRDLCRSPCIFSKGANRLKSVASYSLVTLGIILCSILHLCSCCSHSIAKALDSLVFLFICLSSETQILRARLAITPFESRFLPNRPFSMPTPTFSLDDIVGLQGSFRGVDTKLPWSKASFEPFGLAVEFSNLPAEVSMFRMTSLRHRSAISYERAESMLICEHQYSFY